MEVPRQAAPVRRAAFQRLGFVLAPSPTRPGKDGQIEAHVRPIVDSTIEPVSSRQTMWAVLGVTQFHRRSVFGPSLGMARFIGLAGPLVVALR